jgi:hypothetical protein
MQKLDGDIELQIAMPATVDDPHAAFADSAMQLASANALKLQIGIIRHSNSSQPPAPWCIPSTNYFKIPGVCKRKAIRQRKSISAWQDGQAIGRAFGGGHSTAYTARGEK